MRSGVLGDMLGVVQKQGYKIDSITVVRNGFLVADAYFYPFRKGMKHSIHSCTKSIISSLIGAEVMGLLLYFGQKNYGSFKFALPYLIIVPLIQLTGLVSSLKSIPYIEEWGDKDYAQGGLFMNIIFL
jgi:hypothetical protein